MLTSLLVVAVALSPAAASAPPTCTSASILVSACATNTGSSVELSGEHHTPGSGGGNSGGSAGAAGPTEKDIRPEWDGCTLLGNPGKENELACLGPAEAEPVEGIPEVTAQDLAAFSPQRPSLHAEPEGVGVVGMPANFVAAVPAHSIAGSLFGRSVTVRFTPVAYVFSYGDGAQARTATGGASWAELGQAQFTATATSHSYGARGTYTVSVSVEYAAAVDFGVGRWFPVRGVVTADTGGYPVEIYEVQTALVDRTCAEDPAGPGC